MNEKVKYAKLSIISNSGLILLKFIVGIITGSVSIISEAIHSAMDLAASLIAYVSVRLSDTPPDKGHPYGHQKIENISGVIEAMLIIMASFFIIREAIKKLIQHQHVTMVGWGFAVMLVSAVVNIIVSKKLYKVARKEESVALEADALHLKADVYTSFGVSLGLLILWITDLHFLDPIVAIIIALLILKEAFEMLKQAYTPLLDSQLSDDEVKKVGAVLDKYKDIFTGFHELRTRRAGKMKYIDLHLNAPKDMTIKEYHENCDLIETDIETALKNTNVLVHIEPCTDQCGGCVLKDKSKYCKSGS
ncbi:MAG: cation diffusion facilitator family transporter [Elusimicrobia bacterium]|nr:cation diffusion facilitator family transporter [Candidatus Liberimonas magnetica]